jgi:hypothetical protein
VREENENLYIKIKSRLNRKTFTVYGKKTAWSMEKTVNIEENYIGIRKLLSKETK